ncbi:MAG: hypothetical protein ACE5MM_07720, partial [Nitrospiraceae bacterium]
MMKALTGETAISGDTARGEPRGTSTDPSANGDGAYAQPVGYTARRRAVFDALARKRDRFKARRWYYYQHLTAFVQFLVPPGQRVLEV